MRLYKALYLNWRPCYVGAFECLAEDEYDFVFKFGKWMIEENGCGGYNSDGVIYDCIVRLDDFYAGDPDRPGEPFYP